MASGVTRWAQPACDMLLTCVPLLDASWVSTGRPYSVPLPKLDAPGTTYPSHAAKEECMARKGHGASCSFCGKSQEQVRRLIAGPNLVFICDECVALCNEIIAETPPRPTPPKQGGGWRATTKSNAVEHGDETP